jgi:uncharacterized protein YjbI with pentapeptide repeats
MDTLPEEEYCYWHKMVDGKTPTDEQLLDLKEKEIRDVYLKKANLQGADLTKANLFRAQLTGANLEKADLTEADLRVANLQGANLIDANLQRADLRVANLQGAQLNFANLQEAGLRVANLQGANLIYTNLQGTNLAGAKFDNKTALDQSEMNGANLFQSYFDEAKSFRNVNVPPEGGGKEINEVVGDSQIRFFDRFKKYTAKLISILEYILIHLRLPLPLKQLINIKYTYILNFSKLPNDFAYKLNGKGLIRYVKESDRIIFIDIKNKSVIKNPEKGLLDKDNLVEVEGFTDLFSKDGEIQKKFLYSGSRASLYEASYEVYNNLYNFYISNGRLDKSAQIHYRREEVHRKLRWEQGLQQRLRSIFDLLILRTLTGYGDKILRPIVFSIFVVFMFAVLFKLSDGIVKTVNVPVNGTVNETVVAPDCVDYLYHSVTTFTSLGYSNIQPNLAAGHLPQLLVSVESGLGVVMIALIIFVITYQVSR